MSEFVFNFRLRIGRIFCCVKGKLNREESNDTEPSTPVSK